MGRELNLNLKRYYIHTILYNAVLILVTGGILQTFMLESGIDGKLVSPFVGIMQAVQAVSMLSMSGYIEKSKDVLRLNARLNFGLFPLLLALLMLCFAKEIAPGVKFTVLVVSGAVSYFSLGMLGVIEYKLPYDIMDMKNYGTVCSVNGAMVGIGCMAITSVMTFFLSLKDYFGVMSVFLSVGALTLAAAVWTAYRYRRLDVNGERKERRNKGSGELFRYKPFWLLILPNFARGFAYGTTAIMTTAGYRYGIIDSVKAGYMVLIGNTVVIAGCFLYSRLARLKNDGLVTMLCCIVLLFSMPAMLIGSSSGMFLLMYGLTIFFRTIVDYAIPVALMEIVDYSLIGRFSSWRMGLFMLGAASAGFLLVPMLDTLGGVTTLAINGGVSLFVGISYYLVIKACRDGKIS